MSPADSALAADRRRASLCSVVMIASEAAPWAKTGGLADVVGALGGVLARQGYRTTTILPRYRGVDVSKAAALPARTITLGAVSHDVVFHVQSVSDGCRLVLVDAPALFDRGGLYGERGSEFADNGERFAILAGAALEFLQIDPERWPVDVLHAHDWQAGLVPVLVRTDPERFSRSAAAATVFTIHNLAYQGLFDRDLVPALGLPWSVFQVTTGEFWGRFGFLKCGVNYSDWVTTVSPTYARETQRPEMGAGLDGVLAALAERYTGILNGIDTTVWNPATDVYLPAHFDRTALSGKIACKRALLEHFQLPLGDDAMARPVVGMVSRLVAQKGLDLVEEAHEALVDLDASWIFVGVGDAKYEQFLRTLAARHPSRVAVYLGFSEALAHLVEAGADLFLMPSIFEPCGLNQMYSLRYGTVPVVHGVGGLEDTIQPYTARARRANGFKFRPATPDLLVRTLRQAVRLYHNKAAWLPLMRNGMAADHSWETSAKEYGKVYRRARRIAAERGGR